MSFIHAGTKYKILAVGRPLESKTNDSAADQDYASIFSIPANYLTAGKVIRVTLEFQYTTGVTTSTVGFYIKLGGVKVFTSNAGVDLPNSITRSQPVVLLIYGTAAAGASVPVENLPGTYAIPGGSVNNTVQPVNLATNGALTVVPGIVYSATGSTETMVLRTYLIEALN